jgi:hypothetical protein
MQGSSDAVCYVTMLAKRSDELFNAVFTVCAANAAFEPEPRAVTLFPTKICAIMPCARHHDFQRWDTSSNYDLGSW